MQKLLLLIAFIASIATPSIALTKSEALACVTKGVNAFLGGKQISHLVDVPYMITRENINANEARVKQLLDQASKENVGYYQNVTAKVVGQPQAKKGGFFLVAGIVTGEETKSLEDVAWQKFSYQYIIWVRKEDTTCRIGVIAIEEVFRLASWVKSKL